MARLRPPFDHCSCEACITGIRELERQLRAFHHVIGATIGHIPGFRDAALRADLIAEEAAETVAAIRAGDMVETIDGLCDLIYVCFGTAVTFGIPLQPFWDEVHESNMRKGDGPMRADGKRLKPEGWQGPRIAEMYAELVRQRGEE